MTCYDGRVELNHSSTAEKNWAFTRGRHEVVRLAAIYYLTPSPAVSMVEPGFLSSADTHAAVPRPGGLRECETRWAGV